MSQPQHRRSPSDERERAVVFPKLSYLSSPNRGRKKTLSNSHQGTWVAHDNSLDSILQNKVLSEGFRDFLCRNFSEENLSFWLDAEKFKSTKFSSPADLKREANKIYKKYSQVHIPSEMRTQLLINLENPTQELFKDLQEEMANVLQTDSIPKFYRSDIYQALRPLEDKEIEFIAPKAGLILKSFTSFLAQYLNETKAEEVNNLLQIIGGECAELYREKKDS